MVPVRAYSGGGYHRGGGIGPGVAAGVAGAVIGGAIASQGYYGGPGYYAADPVIMTMGIMTMAAAR